MTGGIAVRQDWWSSAPPRIHPRAPAPPGEPRGGGRDRGYGGADRGEDGRQRTGGGRGPRGYGGRRDEPARAPARQEARSQVRARSARGRRDDDGDWPSTEWDKLSDADYWKEV